MLYPQSQDELLKTETFQNPGKEYRSAPFWAWNCKLDKKLIRQEIEDFQEMGFGGFHCHVRTGMESEYLTDEFMDFIRYAKEVGTQHNLLTYLYDEDRWPSGTNGGKITKEFPRYRLQYLVFTQVPMEKGRNREGGVVGTVYFKQKDYGKLIAVFDVELNSDGTLKRYHRCSEDDEVSGQPWFVYQMEGDTNDWFNGGTYLDTMNPEAVQEFLHQTYQKYYDSFHESFGSNMKTIFTDEPQVLNKVTLRTATDDHDCWVPWTWDFTETYKKTTGLDIIEHLPELVWELPDGKISKIRYEYHNHVAERFTKAYPDAIADWCDKHGILSTGHMLKEPTLESQTISMGDVMRAYRKMPVPGIDMLHNLYEYNTAKQCQSIVHQQNREGMMCEIYGVTGWDFDFRGFKQQGDWLAALGVTFRVPHLAWMSMKGEAKRDYPPSIGYQSPWYKKFSLIENHFARLNTVLTRGKAQVNVCVIHPIESYWLHWGPSEQTKAIRERLDNHFKELTEILLFGLIDFDFVDEACLPEQYQESAAGFQIGSMTYQTVIVPDCETLRSTTVTALENFRKAGGRVIFLCECPKYVDALRSDRVQKLYMESEKVSFDSASVLSALEQERFLDIHTEDGERTDDLISQVRCDGARKWVFITSGREPKSKDVDLSHHLRISLQGTYKVNRYNTLDASITEMPVVEYKDDRTFLEYSWHMQDSLLLELTEGMQKVSAYNEKREEPFKVNRIFEKIPVSLSEPNALLLDYADFRMNQEEFQECQEILRIDNLCRKRLGIPLRKKNIKQPYLIKKEPAKNTVTLRFHIASEVDLVGLHLALETPELFSISWNGQEINNTPDGWYVDQAIKTIPIPELHKGDNVLEITEPIAAWTNMEWCYLLGDFGVNVEGTIKTITKPIREIAFCDYAQHGLPFYTGNLIYHLEQEILKPCRLKIRVPVYRGALIGVMLDGAYAGDIIYSPYELDLGNVNSGKHRIDLILYGNRENGFGQLHHDKTLPYKKAPNSWRSEGDLWIDEYQLVPMGILKAPEIKLFKI